jgi:hypothetical protein
VLQNGDGIVGVLLGHGDGTFQPPVSYIGSGPGVLGDVNGDGNLDIVGSGAVLLGMGDGTFGAAIAYPAGGTSVAIADLNGDAHTDLAVTNSARCGRYSCGHVQVLSGIGNGTFQAPTTYSSGCDNGGPFSIAVEDLNGDSRPDVVAGNWGCDSVGVLLNNFRAKTTTTLTSSLNPSQIGQQVTFTATVVATIPVPDGSPITFYKGPTIIGTGTTTNGIAILSVAFPKALTYAIKAAYHGDAFHNASAGRVQQVVTQDSGGHSLSATNESGRSNPQPADAWKACGTTTYLSSSGSPSLITNTVTFTAQAIANSWCKGNQMNCDEGGVVFYDGHTVIGTIPVNNCQAEIETDSLTAGNHRIVATFEPGTGWHQSSAHLTQVVDRWPTVTTATSTPNPSSYGEPVTFTATAVSTQNGPPPTGSVRFRNGAKLIGTAILDENGRATFTTKLLPVGGNSITAKYTGDSYNACSTSSVLNQVVNPAAK